MNEMMVERRSGRDRRVNNSISFRALLLGGRRERGRRKEDKIKTFVVDRYSPFFLAAIAGTLFLSVIDALLTLFLISRGAAFELNPVMAYYIELGPYSFLAVKYALTCVAVVSFLLLRNIYIRPFRIYTGSLFYVILAVFATVVAWQIYLVTLVIA